MKKKILILHTNMELGGAETSLLGLLWSLDYDRVSVDLFLYAHTGELLPLLPDAVRLLPEQPAYRALCDPIRTAIRQGHPVVAGVRLRAKLVTAIRNRKMHFRDYGHALKQRTHAYAVRHLPRIGGDYDMAISFIDPHWIMNRRTSAPVRLGWFHTDCALITPDNPLEEKMWSECTHVVNVSESCKAAFDAVHPALTARSFVMENILAKRFVESRAEVPLPADGMRRDGHINLLSVGRFCEAKNFDNVPDIARRLLADGLPIRWYIIGYGGDEPLIRRRIAEAGMEEAVIPITYHHPEVGGAGQFEIEPKLGEMSKMADATMLIKYIIHNTALKYGKSATFMPKPVYGEAGSGMHVHMLLLKDGEPVFSDDNGYSHLSQEAHWFMGGLLKHIHSLCAITNPSTNSFKRLVPGFEAPVTVGYATSNRSAVIRIPAYAKTPNMRRFELRNPDATCNPYFCYAALLMAGLDGIENKIDPHENGWGPYDVNLYTLSDEEKAKLQGLPTSLNAALDALEADHDYLTKGGVFPEALLRSFIAAKRRECAAMAAIPHPAEFERYYNL